MKSFTTINSKQTQKLGELLAEEILATKKLNLSRPKQPKEVELRKALVICLDGELGAGKTTFTQGLLKGLKIEGPYTSPTFLIMKEYCLSKGSTFKIPKVEPLAIEKVYHFDAYRVEAQDILNLGWEEILSPPAGGSKNIIIIEWADRIKEIIPADAIWIKFKWLEEDERKITFTKY
ncbi:MAG: tRNA (adenosine(37)-N6)-threonylcarbamoyltransferase complex ATPase subunit type 1 TsaE [Candidatus Moranbacteria bacterium RIFOXYA12_FULL_35_19]|nr:MAG: hypothetical protein UR78_C0016G0008 [Candidatus Moranbacteria bacterium GW2011_GWF2_35_39]OGI32411.1 MAG: tRNA (adenosine(37)-N6)-threonylcarbamoyltransferase complex ATPase subunit type 1 TsaE [Candidatus Moranbacteria bacterium RIFOXYC12_FULL_36_13]OGI33105.1 MAG: tRNA (adenosine(37)-N6)-threonylcarbamoyltransferase complex ATPase subunit type 1 TsaE [Candidatus Moranbacteria bacterium RIFOXYB12_FULL_35_8]OGI35495.1 MAG: tRNA (adenosine(37)-N6)-threonylcarbamoyltransferase complex ATP